MSDDNANRKATLRQSSLQLSRQQLQQALDDWLDGKAVDESIQARWLEDEQMASVYLAAQDMRQQAEQFEPLEVPSWDASSTFVSQNNSFGQSWQEKIASWFDPSPRLSMAFSIVALCMVIFNVEVQFDDGKMAIAFGGSQQASQDAMRAELEQQFEQRLVAYSRDQQILIANYFDDIQAKQQEDVTQLASYLINASRQERKEDIGALVSYFKQLRSDDLSLNQQQLNQLVYQLQQDQQGRDGHFRRANRQVSDSADLNSTFSNQEEQ